MGWKPVGKPLSNSPGMLRPSLKGGAAKTPVSLIAPISPAGPIAPAGPMAPAGPKPPAESKSPAELKSPGDPSPGAPAAPEASAAATASGTAEPPPKPHFPLPAEMPTQLGPDGLRFDFNFGARVIVPETGRALAHQALGSRHRQYPLRDDRPEGLGQQRQALLHPGAHRGVRRRSPRLHPRLRLPRQRGADPVAGGHAGGQHGLVPLRGEIPARPRLPPERVDGGEPDPAVSRRLSGDRVSHPRAGGRHSVTMRPTTSACFSTTRSAFISRATSGWSVCTGPPATSSASIRRRSRRASCRAAPTARSPSAMSASRCKAPPRRNTGTIRSAGARSSAF